MREYRRVSTVFRRWSIVAAVLGVALAGCGERNAPERADKGAPQFNGTSEELAWQGVVACADCDGIDTRLRLHRGNGVVAQYELVEAFLVGEGAEYFHEEGRWRRDGRVLRLQPSAGGERLFAIDPAGNLIVIDREGRVAGESHVLSPVGPTPRL